MLKFLSKKEAEKLKNLVDYENSLISRNVKLEAREALIKEKESIIVEAKASKETIKTLREAIDKLTYEKNIKDAELKAIAEIEKTKLEHKVAMALEAQAQEVMTKKLELEKANIEAESKRIEDYNNKTLKKYDELSADVKKYNSEILEVFKSQAKNAPVINVSK